MLPNINKFLDLVPSDISKTVANELRILLFLTKDICTNFSKVQYFDLNINRNKCILILN